MFALSSVFFLQIRNDCILSNIKKFKPKMTPNYLKLVILKTAFIMHNIFKDIKNFLVFIYIFTSLQLSNQSDYCLDLVFPIFLLCVCASFVSGPHLVEYMDKNPN